jgi:hypothetical protein
MDLFHREVGFLLIVILLKLILSIYIKLIALLDKLEKKKKV